jgi:hypothetical protein
MIGGGQSAGVQANRTEGTPQPDPTFLGSLGRPGLNRKPSAWACAQLPGLQ